MERKRGGNSSGNAEMLGLMRQLVDSQHDQIDSLAESRESRKGVMDAIKTLTGVVEGLRREIAPVLGRLEVGG